MSISIASITPSPDLSAAKAGTGPGGDGFAPLIAGLLGPGELAPTCTLLPPDGDALPVAPGADPVAATPIGAGIPTPDGFGLASPPPIVAGPPRPARTAPDAPQPDVAQGETAPMRPVPPPPPNGPSGLIGLLTGTALPAVVRLTARAAEQAPEGQGLPVRPKATPVATPPVVLAEIRASAAPAADADPVTTDDAEQPVSEQDTTAVAVVFAPLMVPIAVVAGAADPSPPTNIAPADVPSASALHAGPQARAVPTADMIGTASIMPGQAPFVDAPKPSLGPITTADTAGATAANPAVTPPPSRHPGLEPGSRFFLPSAAGINPVAVPPAAASLPTPQLLPDSGTPAQVRGDNGEGGAVLPSRPLVASRIRAGSVGGQSPDPQAEPRSAPRPSAAPVPTSNAPVILPALQAFAGAMRKGWADARKSAATPVDSPAAILAPAGAPAAPATVQPAQTALDTADRRWPHAMAEQIERLRDAAEETSTRIRLLPDALGPVDVAVRRDGDRVHVQFSAAQAETRQLLAEAQPRLAEAADARGLKLGRTDVAAGDPQTGERQQRPPAHVPPSSRPAPARARAAVADTTDTRIA